MPRPKLIEPRVPLKIYFNQKNAAALRLLTTSSLTTKTSYGELSQVVNTAVEFYLAHLKKESPDVQP